MEKRIKAALVVVIALCLALSIGAAKARADSDGAATVTASALNMRSEPSTSGSILTCLPRGTTVIVTGTSGGWYQVSYNGTTGYMSGDYLSLSDAADGSFGSGTVTGNAVRVRSGAGTSYSVLGSLNKGASLAVTGVSGAWYKVSYNGSAGYISSSYLSLGSSSGTSSTPASTPAPSPSSGASGTGTIRGSGVRLRSGPSTSSTILGSYNTGTVMTVTGESGDWYKVRYNGSEGYVYKSYLTLGGSSGSSSSAASGSYSVTAMDATTATAISAVHMRTGPGTSYASQRVLSAGTTVTLTGSTDEWYRVTYNGSEGFVYKTYLSTSASSSSSSSAGERLITEAKKYLGVPYVYGGTSPSGFDCSGFVYYIYRQCGYSITRTAVTQNGDGTKVERSQLQPGDIVIFYNSAMSGIGHSGLYIGNGQFIHASSGAGKVVISDLSSTYYNTHYYSARRVVG